jgi:adenylate kinase
MDTPQFKSPVAAKPVENLEVKDAQVIFTNVWNTLEEEFGHENLRFSKELILLGGAPGSGKGTNTEFIMKARDLTCEPIIVSSAGRAHQAGRRNGG